MGRHFAIRMRGVFATAVAIATTAERRGVRMRTIGLIGGMSWESTAVYYRRINEQVRNRLGGLNSADVLMRSVNFDRIVNLQKNDAWDAAGRILAGIAHDLQGAGAACLLICTNTMHKLAEPVQQAVEIPLLHIADVTAAAVKSAGVGRPLLLATRYTMEHDFYLRRLRDAHGLDPIVPEAADRDVIHGVIFDELCRGIVREQSRRRYIEIVERSRARGADGVILGCTEIGLLIGPEHLALPLFDSTLLHADAAVDFAIGQGFAPGAGAAHTDDRGTNPAPASAA
jgi:aspartate racemase